MPTTGWLRRIAPVDPKNRASPKLKMPPSEDSCQYPPLLGVGVMPIIGAASGLPPIEPRYGAPPKEYTAPSAAVDQ